MLHFLMNMPVLKVQKYQKQILQKNEQKYLPSSALAEFCLCLGYYENKVMFFLRFSDLYKRVAVDNSYKFQCHYIQLVTEIQNYSENF